MEIEIAKRELRRVVTAYPSLREFLHRTDSDGSKNETFAVWCGMLEPCDESDVVMIVDEIVRGVREPWGRYEKPDSVARNIAAEARRIRGERDGRSVQKIKYHDVMQGVREDSPKFAKTWRASLALGGMVRDRKISRDENRVRLEIVMAWFSGRADEPNWDLILKPEAA